VARIELRIIDETAKREPPRTLSERIQEEALTFLDPL
jgi:hypothetical protein